jgi:hypothetical protein
MNEFEWVVEQCYYTEKHLQDVIGICKALRYPTIESYVDNLRRRRRLALVKLKSLSSSTKNNIENEIICVQNTINSLNERIPMLHMMAKSHPEKLHLKPFKQGLHF